MSQILWERSREEAEREEEESKRIDYIQGSKEIMQRRGKPRRCPVDYHELPCHTEHGGRFSSGCICKIGDEFLL